ncbi:MAG: RNA pyrophosphohydrolase [Pseudomonadota bacterium]
MTDDLPYRPCVGVMLANDEGEVFVGERIDTPGAWQMPQGGIDQGESPIDAALRELWEETGITASLVTVEAMSEDWLHYDLPDHLRGKLWKGKFRGQKQKWALMRFNGCDDDVDILTAHPEFSAWQWLDPADVLDHIVPFKREVYSQVLALFGPKI